MSIAFKELKLQSLVNLRAVYKRKKSPNRLFSFIDAAAHLHLNNCYLARAYEIGLT